MKTTLLFIAIIVGLFYSCNSLNENSQSIKLIPYKSGDKWGYIDKEGKILINPQFNYANIFINGIALVKSADNKFGYIGEDGKYIINATYKDATFFSEGLACVVPENDHPQFIDEKGNIKFTVSTGEQCGIFNEGLAAVKVKEKWGYLDKEGTIKINPQFEYAQSFHDGLAAIATTNKENGETLWGYLNNKGEITINYQFKYVGNFNDGIAKVYDGKNYGYIDKTGKYIINPQFDYAGEFTNGFAIIKQGSMYGYIDKTGKIIINPQFNSASIFSENGLASVSSSDGKYGYIDEDGKYVINPQFDRGSEFLGDIAFVKSADKMGIIDEKGKYLVNPQFDAVNVDVNNYKYKTVETDYFDVNAIVDKFLEGTDQRSFRSLTSTTTVGDLKISFPDLSLNSYGWSARSTNKIVLNDFSFINEVNFSFTESPILAQRPVYRTVQKYDYWKGSYNTQELDHYENTPNDNAPLQSVTFSLELSGDKTVNKSEQIFKGIRDALVTKSSMFSPSSGNVDENDFMTIVIGGSGVGTGSRAIYQITFKSTNTKDN